MFAVVNTAENWGIGCHGQLLVSISADLRRFRELTTGKTVVLGRKTLETFPGGKPLRNRTNLVLSGSVSEIAGAEVLPNLQALRLRLGREDPAQVAVIGGESVYRLLLPYCDRVWLTVTEGSPEADAFFPNLEAADGWKRTEKGEWQEENGIRFRYDLWENESPAEL